MFSYRPGQYLNLIKNSSLGAAIGYYDITLVTQTAADCDGPEA